MGSYIVFLIIVPCIFVLLGLKLLKDKSWIMIGIELIPLLLLTFIDIIENNPTGNMKGQLNSYFGNLLNDFYLKYLPCIFLSIILMFLLKGTYKRKDNT